MMAAAPQEGQYNWKDYKAELKSVWCPGCGDFGVANAIYHGLTKLQLPPHEVTIVSGIGCSGRVSGYVNTYGLHGVHGRVLPISQGVKMANPELTVIATGGDGDGLSIGAGHFPHAARRNMDITYIMFDNNVYGLTKGQMSPTTPIGDVTPTSKYGVTEEPIEPISLALVYKASFIARTYSSDFRQMADLIVEAVNHPGFSFIQALSPCITFRGKGEFDRIRNGSYYVDKDHDVSDRQAAFSLAEETDQIPLGLIYKDTSRPTFQEKVAGIQKRALAKGSPSVEEMVELFEP